MLTKEQEELLASIARRDGAYVTEPTERGVRHMTVGGEEICRDEAEARPSEIEQLKARVAELEAALTRSR